MRSGWPGWSGLWNESVPEVPEGPRLVEDWLEAIASAGEPDAAEIAMRWHRSGQLSRDELARYALWQRKRLHRAYVDAEADGSAADAERARGEAAARAAAFETDLARMREDASTGPKDARKARLTPTSARDTAFRWLVPVLCVIAVGFGVGFAVDGWAVAHGRGETGTFTATQIGHCGKGCEFLGDFTSTGRPTPDLSGVNPMGGLDVHRVGDRVPAVLYDGTVYPPGGGGAWQRAVVLLAAGVLGLALWSRHMVRRRRRRHDGRPRQRG